MDFAALDAAMGVLAYSELSRGPDAHAILSRIAAGSTPWGADDDRTADQRRLDAFRDLLLGRDQFPLIAEDQPLPTVDRCGSGEED